MTKPESETDPWAKVRTFDVSTYGDCRMERDYYGEIASEQKYPRGEYAWVDEVDAARAAEAAQHRQFKAAIATALCVENEHGPVSEESIVEAAEVTLGQLFDLSARLAAVEAERDRLKAALQALLELGRKDTSNPKYDGYYDEARAALTPQGQSTDGEIK